MEEACSFCPAMAVPTTVKIPEPMTAPIPSEVRLSQPSDFFNRRSGSSASEINWSMFLTRKSVELNRHHPHAGLAVAVTLPCGGVSRNNLQAQAQVKLAYRSISFLVP